MPPQSNESSATPRPWVSEDGTYIVKGNKTILELWDETKYSAVPGTSVPKAEEMWSNCNLILTAVNAYDENQTTIKDLQERLEKQRAVIKDLITASKMALKVLDGLPFKKNFDARNYIENVLNAIPEELL